MIGFVTMIYLTNIAIDYCQAQCSQPDFEAARIIALRAVLTSIIAEDFNADNRIDLVVANRDTNNISILIR
jgi:hypothetical protein